MATEFSRIPLAGATGPVIITGSGSPESSISAPVGSLYFRTDGSNATAHYVKGSGTSNTGWATSELISHDYSISCHIAGVPGDAAICYCWVSPWAGTMPASLTGSKVKAQVAANAATTLTIKVNGSTKGTINVAQSATTATFTFSAAVTLAAGDVVTIHNQATKDTTLADIAVSLLITRTDTTA